MKVHVVFLALIIFAGSQAFVLRDESKSKVDELEWELKHCSDILLREFFRKADMVANSEIVKAVSPWFHNVQERWERLSKALQDASPPEVNELDRQLQSAYRDMGNKAYNEMNALGRNMHDEMEAFYVALKSDLNPVLERLDPYTQPLYQSFVRTCAELDEKLTEVLKPPLEKLQPLAKEIPSKLQEVENSLNPIVGWVQKSIIAEVEAAHDALQQFAAHVLGVINKHRESFHQWFQSPFFPVDH